MEFQGKIQVIKNSVECGEVYMEFLYWTGMGSRFTCSCSCSCSYE